MESHELLEMISTFPNIETLAMWRANNISSELAKMDDLPLRKLSIDMPLAGIQTRPVFKNLTHLEIINASMKKLDDCKALIELPKLTHFCFDTSVRVEVTAILDLLKHCASLRVLIVLSLSTLDNPRFLVLADQMPLNELIEEWGRSANGLIGCWELAEIIVQARKATHNRVQCRSENFRLRPE